MTEPEHPPLISLQELADNLELPLRVVKDLVRSGCIPVVYRGRRHTKVNWTVIHEHIRSGGELTHHWWERR